MVVAALGAMDYVVVIFAVIFILGALGWSVAVWYQESREGRTGGRS